LTTISEASFRNSWLSNRGAFTTPTLNNQSEVCSALTWRVSTVLPGHTILYNSPLTRPPLYRNRMEILQCATQSIKSRNQLPAGLLASLPCKLNTFRKRVKNVVTNKGTEVGIGLNNRSDVKCTDVEWTDVIYVKWFCFEVKWNEMS